MSIRHLSVRFRVHSASFVSKDKGGRHKHKQRERGDTVGWLGAENQMKKKKPQNTLMMRYDLAMATALTTLWMSGGFPSVYINH